MKNFYLIGFIFILIQCHSNKQQITIKDEVLKIQPLNKNLYQHISYLNIPNYGKFPCNGVVYIHQGEAIIFDTPIDDTASNELINWLEKKKKVKIKGVVVNHFHVDCLGGLAAFHEKNIPSFAHQKTIELAKADGAIVPTNGFEQMLEIPIGDKKVENRFLGEAHSKDNIVSWIPTEKALFGGCMLKSLNAKKGNLNDANVEEWANTIGKVKVQYPDLKIAVPGHGNSGGMELLDYTMELFGKN